MVKARFTSNCLKADVSVRKVQILIDGNITEIIRDGVDLSQVFSRNLDIVVGQ